MPFGRCAFLLCGDLFNETCLTMLTDVDWLMVPMARCFDSDVNDVAQWYAEERHYYARQAAKAGINMLLVNQPTQCADSDYFGGATVFTRTGDIIAEYPLQQPGMLVVDL
jgi:predicted amidohydrolase